MRPTLVVMLKEPRPGRVKTRLGRDIGMVEAAWWFRHQSAALLRRIEDPRWRLALAVTPDRAGLQSRVWPGHLPRWAQGRGDLGARMARMLRRAGSGPVCVIGADIPGIRRYHIAQAFAALGAHDAVFGPAGDGGYWLAGLKHGAPAPRSLFRNVRWSGPHALEDTIASLPGFRIAQVAELHDVDTIDDLSMTTPGVRATSKV
ncbi:TIGR04282 family arsenosugar biosynthesis glycosyltransferase [Sulfitobacter aestuarii]|uniref:TIGR04282 family arsenosugar biosynthesis glycosyltransferase n=1 Tax=Sulfitobacter aestuarii TaxID=2161676 RepID=A0ABW5U610_9RHOB